MTPEQRVSHARELLANKVLAEVLASIEDGAVAMIAYSEPSDDALRQAKAAEIRVARAIRTQLQSIADLSADTRVKSIA